MSLPQMAPNSHSFSTDPTRSLVCRQCWNGPFAYDTFRNIWETPIVWFNDTTVRPFSYTSTWNCIDASSRDGCNWCSLLLASVDRTKHYDYSEDETSLYRTKSLSIRVAFSSAQYAEKLLLRAQRVRASVNGYEILDYPIYTLLDDPCADEVLARERMCFMKSAKTCRLALDHISYCLDNHAQCPKPALDRVLPTRVIDCTNPEQPRLYLTDGNVRASYLALSYVWGEDQPNKTKLHNLQSYARAIDVSLLPQTARDAIWVTHACAEKYLWIDALCIVQDSKADKRREIANIPKIFANASFTIIAARSSKASEGFLHTCSPPSIPIFRLPFHRQDGSIGTMYVEQDQLGKYADIVNVEDPVHKRAWCLEERLLSTRALLFASDTLRVMCQVNCVNVGDGVRDTHDLASHRLSIEWMPGPGDEPFDAKAPSAYDYNRSTTLWDNIVHNYTGRKVTQIDDKLVALAGVAACFSARWRKGEYLAGLWLDNLQHDLLWHMTADAELPRPDYRAPSWSWASVEGPVEAARLHPHETQLYELVDHRIQLVSEVLPFGGITIGHLRMSARLLKASWSSDGLRVCLPETDSLSSDARNGQPSTEVKIYHAWRDTKELLSMDVWVLLVCWRAKSNELLGLVVVPAGDQTEYRRVGCFQDFPEWTTKEGVQGLRLQYITLL